MDKHHAEEFVAMHLDFYAARLKTMTNLNDEASELIRQGVDAEVLAVTTAQACARGASRDPDDAVAVIEHLILLIECATKPAHAAFREAAKRMIKVIVWQEENKLDA
jgi:hypothetical protein